jgi:hypothetical protein
MTLNARFIQSTKIWLPRQRLIMQYVPEPFGKQELSYKELRLGVLAPDSRHIKASDFLIMNVGHVFF